MLRLLGIFLIVLGYSFIVFSVGFVIGILSSWKRADEKEGSPKND